MHKVTLNYVSGMGEFLDENHIDFYNEGDDKISIFVASPQHVADILMDFRIWAQNNLDY